MDINKGRTILQLIALCRLYRDGGWTIAEAREAIASCSDADLRDNALEMKGIIHSEDVVEMLASDWFWGTIEENTK